MRALAVALLCLLGLAALAGCGGRSSAIDSAVADRLAGQADAIAQKAAAGDVCAARGHARILQRQTIAAINAGRIPAEYQETLQTRVTEIAAALEPRCLPSLSPAPRGAELPPAPNAGSTVKPPKHEPKPKKEPKQEPKPKKHGHGKGKGH
jgi:cell division septation protein DedD